MFVSYSVTTATATINTQKTATYHTLGEWIKWVLQLGNFNMIICWIVIIYPSSTSARYLNEIENMWIALIEIYFCKNQQKTDTQWMKRTKTTKKIYIVFYTYLT